MNEKYIKQISEIKKYHYYIILIDFYKLSETYSKKTKKPLKIASVQPDLDQTLSKFC